MEIKSPLNPSQKPSHWQRSSIIGTIKIIAPLQGTENEKEELKNEELNTHIYCLTGSSLAINLESIFLSCLAFLRSINYASPHSDTW